MEFTLYYRGPLKSNAGPRDKHALRKEFHPQLSRVWKQSGMAKKGLLGDPPSPGEVSVVKDVGLFRCASIVASSLSAIAELRITMLRPEPPGAIVTQGGDIDNRLKTLFDALQVPDQNQAEKIGSPDSDEKPLFCLLEDDKLITMVSVNTHQLLDVEEGSTDTVLIIQVNTKYTKSMICNMDLRT